MGTAPRVSQGTFAPLPSVNSCPSSLTATHSLQRVSSSCASCTAAAEAAQPLQQCQAAVQAALQLQAAEQAQAASQLVPPEQRTVFFAGVPPMVTEQQLVLLFSNFGPVEQINLFKPFNNSRTSKGCGLVVFATRPGAAAAIAALHGSFRWPNARAPMVAEWMDPRKAHRKVRTHLLMALQPGQLLYAGMPAAPLLPEVPAQQPATAAAAAAVHQTTVQAQPGDHMRKLWDWSPSGSTGGWCPAP